MNTDHNLSPRQLKRAAIVCFSAVAVLVLVATTAHCQDAPRKKDTAFKLTAATFAGLAAVDVYQSAPCLHSTTCKEVSPVYTQTNPAGFIAIKAAGVGTITWMAWKARKTHPKLAWGLLIGATATQGFVVAYNARQGPKRP